MLLVEMMKHFCDKICILYNKFTESPFFLKIIVLFSFCHDSLKGPMDRICERVPIIQKITDYVSNSMTEMYCSLMNIKCEPPKKTNWYNLVVEYLSKEHEFLTYEQYNEMIIDAQDIGLDHFFKSTTNMVEYALKDFGTVIESLCIVKYFQYYICRIIQPESLPIPSIENLEIVNNRFLSIEYTHPSMKEGIQLDLDKGYYVVNNEILSSSFIKRCLEYQSKHYNYDLKYKLVLMDSSMELIFLTSDQYIQITEDGYKINNIKN